MDAQEKRTRALAVIELLSRSHLWALEAQVTVWMLLTLGLRDGWEAARPSVQGNGSNKVAIIPIQGVLSNNGPGWYGTNYGSIISAAEQAAADPSIKRVVLLVNSPGGEVTGLPEAGAVLQQLAKVKPVSAVVEGMSASAAYWLTSQATDITVTPSGEVGSVGVRMMHVDVSKMLEDFGYKITELYSGNFKTEWSPFKPLSDEAKTDMQARLDDAHNQFLQAVTAGRGPRATADIIAGRFGEGRMFDSKVALGHGMVDKIQSTREFMRSVLPQEEETSAPVGLPRRARLELERKRH